MIIKMKAFATGDRHAVAVANHYDVWVNMDQVSTVSVKPGFNGYVELLGHLIPLSDWDRAVREYHDVKYKIDTSPEESDTDAIPNFIPINGNSRKSAVDWLTQHGYTVMDNCVLWFEAMLPQNWGYNHVHELLGFAAQQGWKP